MGYCYVIESTSNRIDIDELQSIIDHMPEKFKRSSPLGYSMKQSWGWSLACDVRFPTENSFSISGSYGISGDIAPEFVQYFTEELSKNGHKLNIEYSS